MATKTLIIDALGEPALLLPQKLQAALVANDRLKLCFSVLQAAQWHADHPGEAVPDLAADLRAAAVDCNLEATIGESELEADGSLHIPGATRLRQIIVDDIAAMCSPLALAGVPAAAALNERAASLIAALPGFSDDRVPKGLIDAVTSISRTTPADSLHALVMDLHRAINALQGSLSEEELDGARVWRIAAADRPLIRAFMSGLSETAPLKFDHPGLGTTATRVDQRLIIQNDIGTTDAHVLVLHVEGLKVTLTYTDIHARRVAFFQSLFKPFPVQWTQSSAKPQAEFPSESGYILSVAHFEATEERQLARYLAFLGSRIVFLIDWNRARKCLRQFLAKAEVVRLLKWAADNKIGHRGFLQLGGERLLYEAIEFAQQTPLHYGERLDETLGAEAAFDYLQFVLKEASAGLLAGRSQRFIRDEIKTELAGRFRTAQASLLMIALRLAERVFDLASGVYDGLVRASEPQARQLHERTARRARQWEQECDAFVSRIRTLATHTVSTEGYVALMHAADDAADDLEEASFLLTHLSTVAAPDELIRPVGALAALLVAGAQELVKMFEAASHVTREAAREDLEDFFTAVDRIVAIEHETDSAERAVTDALLLNPIDIRAFYLLSNLSRLLEGAADALSLSALKLRDLLLQEIRTA